MDAPVRSNNIPVIPPARLAHAQLIREIEVKLSEVEDTLKTLKPSDRPDGKLSYDANKQKFMPRAGGIRRFFANGQTCHEVIDGLYKLNARLCELYAKVRTLPNVEEYAVIRNEKRMRVESLARVVQDVAAPCLEYMIEQYSQNAKDLESIKQIISYSDNMKKCIGETQRLLSKPVDAHPLLQSILSAHAHDFEEIYTLPKLPVPAAIECAAHLLSAHNEHVEQLQSVKYVPNQLLRIPHGLVARCLSDITKLKSKECPKEDLKKAIVIKTNEARRFDKCATLIGPGGQKWNSLQIQKFANKTHIAPDAVTPTSERDTHDENNHLVNFKAHIDERDNQMIVTCGVINTQRKADEFIEGLERQMAQRNKQGPKHKLRIVFHQLNSFKNPMGKSEAEYIKAQNQMTNYIEAYFKEKLTNGLYCQEMHIEPTQEPIVSHINLGLNAAVTTFGYIEDSCSHTQNMEGLATQCIWLFNDCSQLAAFKEEQAKAILAKLIELRRDIISAKKSEVAGENVVDHLAQLQAQMNDCLYEVSKLLLTISGRIGSSVETKDAEGFEILGRVKSETELMDLADLHVTKNRLYVMAKMLGAEVLSDQLNIFRRRKFAQDALNFPTLERVEEIELHLLYDMILKAISQINCKSGLDRTGLARSIWNAMRTMHKVYYDKHLTATEGNHALASGLAFDSMVKLIANQKKYIQEIDQMYAEIIKDRRIICVSDLKQMENAFPLQGDLMALIQEKINAKYKGSAEGQEIMDAFNYQNMIGADIFNVAMVITKESTGVAGIKCGKSYGMADLGANPFHPMRLPRYAICDGKIIQLVTDKNALTTAGVQLIICWGNLRGE